MIPSEDALPAPEDDFWTADAMVRPAISYPILGLQGTDNLGGILDDANPLGVGVIQYLTNVGQIMADLTSSITPGLADGSLAPLSFTGNSLGPLLPSSLLSPLSTH